MVVVDRVHATKSVVDASLNQMPCICARDVCVVII